MPFVRGVVSLLLSPSSYLLLLALGLTVWAKVKAFTVLDASQRSLLELPAILASDFAIFLGLAALFAAGERVRARLAWLTIPLAIAALTIAGFNAFYLTVTGGQLSAGAIAMGVERTSDAWYIASREGSLPVLGSSFAFLALLPFLLHRALRTRRVDWLADGELRRARTAGVGSGLGLATWLVVNVALGLPSSMAVGELEANPLKRVYASWLRAVAAPIEGPVHGSPDAVQRWSLTTPDALSWFAATERPNILFVILESTRLDHVELPGASWTSPVATPNIHALAERGGWIDGARAVVPHTTKSLFSMHCGRIPVLTPGVAEVSLQVMPDCLPRTLARAGYDTAFFQSAVGFFERRAALAERFGYGHFEAWEQIEGEALGYLASDDRSLGPAFAAWLDARSGDAPFLATLLTSATHHPYVVPGDVELPAGVEPRGAEDARARYEILIGMEDELIGALMAALEERGLREETIVVVVGDHGEGMPGERIRQHDNNFLEEGLSVPFVMAGPGVPRGRLGRDVSLVGVAPTILARLGLPSTLPVADLRFGVDFHSDAAASRPSPFACYYHDHCYGWVQGGRKVVERPPAAQSFYIDLGADPDEENLLPLAEGMADSLRLLRGMALSTYPAETLVYPPARTLYGEWECTWNQQCRHANTPEDSFHEPPGQD